MSSEKILTFSLLAHIRESGTLIEGPIDIFVPLLKRTLHSLSNGNIIQGKSLLEIKEKADKQYSIDFPIPVLTLILKKIATETNLKCADNFIIHEDNSFIIKNYIFNDYEEKILESNKEIQELELVFKAFCKKHELECFKGDSLLKFIEINKMILSKYLSQHNSNLPEDQSSYQVARFISFAKEIDAKSYMLIRKIYLGSIITGFLEFSLQEKSSSVEVELLLDTNFILGLFDLNTAESSHTCNKLVEISKDLGFRLSIMNDTISEIQYLIRKKVEFWDSNRKENVHDLLYNEADIYSACKRRNFTKVDLERISINIKKNLNQMGIFIINQTDKLKNKAKFSPEYEQLKLRRNTDFAALHDAMALIYVKEKRGKNSGEFREVNCWFVHNNLFKNTNIEKNNNAYQPLSIGCDDLLSILWLSEPFSNIGIIDEDIADIGLSKLIAITLSDNLPHSQIIKELDEKIIKYGSDDITDDEIRVFRTMIANKQIKDLEKIAQKDGSSFVNEFKSNIEYYYQNLQKDNIDLSTTIESLSNENKELQNKLQNLQDTVNSSRIDASSTEKTKYDYVESKLKKWQTQPIYWFVGLLLLNLTIFVILGVTIFQLSEMNWNKSLINFENLINNYTKFGFFAIDGSAFIFIAREWWIRNNRPSDIKNFRELRKEEFDNLNKHK